MRKIFKTFRGFERERLLDDVLSPSLEDYLEMIYRKTRDVEVLRSTDLADELNVSAASITKNIQRLSCLGFLSYEPYGKITLTKLGEVTGEFLYSRHDVIEKFFYVLGAKETGFIETEMIEHYLSSSTVRKIAVLTEFLNKHQNEWEMYATQSEESNENL